MRWLMVLLATTGIASAENERAGDFDYYVLSLSWSPTWCALEGDARQSPQCNAKADFDWVLHGLWPQHDSGWPSYCRTSEHNPSRSDTAAEADLFGTSGNAWHQWNKHGRCTGLSSDNYFRLAREAYGGITRPEIFRRLEKAVRLPASVVEDAFLEANPMLAPDQITITCKAGRIQEARICLTRDLEPTACGDGVDRDCRKQDALFDPVR